MLEEPVPRPLEAGPRPNAPPPRPLESTSVLLAQARSGDDAARERLFARVLPPLQRWAHRRLPAGVRDLHETEDLVQETLLRAFHRLDRFESRGRGTFLAYLRQILLNAIRNEIRRAGRHPAPQQIDPELADPGRSVLEHAVGKEVLEQYEWALDTLSPDHQEAAIMRIELDFTYQEIADHLGLVSSEAARKLVGRTLVKLAERMSERR
jgi:RNA polymerase sigma-70 factor (ECF subfamily)